MTTPHNDLDEEWADGLFALEGPLKALLLRVPVGKRAEYVDDLLMWVRGVTDEVLRTTIESLYAQHYSKATVMTVMNMSTTRLNRLSYGRDLGFDPVYRRYEEPTEYHDVTHLMPQKG